MSAPDTNPETEAAKHAPSLIGIGGAMLWGAVLLVGLIVWITFNGNEPEATAPQNEVGPEVIDSSNDPEG